MNQLKKNSELIKRSMIALLGFLAMIISIVEFSLSFYKENDGWGTDISFNMDSVILFICGLAIFIYGAYCLYAYKKKKDTEAMYYGCFGIVAVMMAFYPCGVFFKAMAKKKPFLENQDYLYIGILGIVMIAYLIFSYISNSKNKKDN